MERFRKLAITVMAGLVGCSEPLMCQAQGPPPASQPAAAGSIPPPRAFAASQPGGHRGVGARRRHSLRRCSRRPRPRAANAVRICRAPLAADADRSAPAAGLDQTFKLKAAPLESTDLRFPINLATALRLSDARPLIVAAAQASVWVAEAELTRAKVLWVPTLNIGFDYLRHDGGGPDFNKGIMTAPSVNFFYGGGGLIQNVATTDVLFQPLVARQNLNSIASRHPDRQERLACR